MPTSTLTTKACRHLGWLLLAMLCGCPSFGQSTKPVILSPNASQIPLKGRLQLAHSGKHLAIRHLEDTQRLNFRQHPTSSFNFGYGSQWHYVKLEVTAQDSLTPYYLLITKPTTQYIQLMIFDEEGKKIQPDKVAGIDFHFRQRSHPNRLFYFDLALKPHHKYTLLICLKNHMDSLNTGIGLYSQVGLDAYKNRYNTFNLIVIGVVGLLCLVALVRLVINATQTRRYYLFYLAYLLCVLFNLLSHEGIAYQVLWSNTPKMATLSKSLFTFLGTPLFMAFAKTFFEGDKSSQLRQNFTRSLRVISLLLGVLLMMLMAALYFWLPALGRWAMMGFNVVVILALVVCMRALYRHFFVFTDNKDWLISALVAIVVSSVCLAGIATLLNNLWALVQSDLLQQRILIQSLFGAEMVASLFLIERYAQLKWRKKEEMIRGLEIEKETEIRIHQREIEKIQQSNEAEKQVKIAAHKQQITLIISSYEAKIANIKTGQKTKKFPDRVMPFAKVALQQLIVDLKAPEHMPHPKFAQFDFNYVTHRFNAYLRKHNSPKTYKPETLDAYLRHLIQQTNYDECHYLNKAYFKPYFAGSATGCFCDPKEFIHLHITDYALAYIQLCLTTQTPPPTIKQVCVNTLAHLPIKKLETLSAYLKDYAYIDDLDDLLQFFASLPRGKQ